MSTLCNLCSGDVEMYQAIVSNYEERLKVSYCSSRYIIRQRYYWPNVREGPNLSLNFSSYCHSSMGFTISYTVVLQKCIDFLPEWSFKRGLKMPSFNHINMNNHESH